MSGLNDDCCLVCDGLNGGFGYGWIACIIREGRESKGLLTVYMDYEIEGVDEKWDYLIF